MAKQATLVTINVYDKMVPLVSGYLEAFARSDADLRRAYTFDKYSTTRTTPVETLVHDLAGRESDVYAFSCYIWNMGLVKSLLPRLLDIRPDAQILLGGPQVMKHAADYADPGHENLVVCNGEGERTFANYLRELIDERPDLSKVRGLSFYRDHELVTTEQEDRIQDLDDIPSPFLNDLFETANYMSVLETNRGCPFRCGFCYWGAANNDRVYRFDESRVREEIAWISRNGTPTVLLADANWGMHKRDIGLSEYISECRQEYFAPMVVHFSAAKNSPHRVAEITKIFKNAGMYSPQPISMQSLDETTLETVDRSNIKLDAFESLQSDLNGSDIGSYIELIWPLPGETLASFQAGVSKLCERRAHTLITYVHLLLHNTPLHARRKELGLVTRPAQDGLAEAEIVVETAEVSARDFVDGMWFIYTVKALYNTHILHALGRYLHTTGVMTYGDLYAEFVDFCQKENRHPFSEFCRESIEQARYYDVTNYPTGYFLVLHDERGAFENLLYRFVSSQPWWEDDNARALFEIDQLSKPFLYGNTPFAVPDIPIEHVRLLDTSDRSYLVEIPRKYMAVLAQTVDENPVFAGSLANGRGSKSSVLCISHDKNQHTHNPRQSIEARSDYCSGVISRLSSVLPEWKMVNNLAN